MGFALLMAIPHKMTFGRRNYLNNKIYGFSMRWNGINIPRNQKRETSVVMYIF